MDNKEIIKSVSQAVGKVIKENVESLNKRIDDIQVTMPKDGIGIKAIAQSEDKKELDIEFDNGQVTTIELPAGEAGPTGEKGEPGLDRPVFQPVPSEPGMSVRKSEFVLHGNGLWQAVRKTSGDPDQDPMGYEVIAAGVKNFIFNEDVGTRTVEFSVELSDGQTQSFTKKIDSLIYQGNWEEKEYDCGDVVTHHGEAWVAKGLVSGEPNENSSDWDRLSKRGDRGRRGEQGIRGEKGISGKDGVGVEDIVADAEKVYFQLTDGTVKIIEFPVDNVDQVQEKPPIKRWAGVWTINETYGRGDMVSATGGIWICLKEAHNKDVYNREYWVRAMATSQGGGGGGGKPQFPTPPSTLGQQIAIWNNVVGYGWTSSSGLINHYPTLLDRDTASAAGTMLNGQLAFVDATGDIYMWVVPTVGVPHWQEFNPRPPRADILQSLVVDPATPGLVTWEDFRDRTETVASENDLWNAATMPLSHLKVGKLVYARDTGTLWECLVDGDAGTATGTIADWKPIVSHMLVVARIGGLPDPSTANPPLQDGQQAMVRLDAFGNVSPTMWVYDATANIWTKSSKSIYSKALRSDTDHSGNKDDLQVTLENGHKELKQRDGAGAWQMVYSEDQVKAWIAAGNSFQGTAQEAGHGTVGASLLSALPAETALGATDAGHYWTFVGTSGHVIGATEVGGAASNIAGARLNVGDWLQVANTGTAAAPVMRWTVIPGDLLAKARGDALYGLNPWSAGAYEQGTIVVYQGKMYRSTGAVLSTNGAPGTAGAPWAAIDLLAGIKTVNGDSDRPAAPVNGEMVLVLSSAAASGKGSIYMWDQPSGHWQPLGGGGGIPLDLHGGQKIQNVGNPIGTVIQFAGSALPTGYLVCDGSTFSAVQYPKLNTVLGGNVLPDLRGQFIRGFAGGTTGDMTAKLGFQKYQDTTRQPRNAFTTSNDGNHHHAYRSYGNAESTWKGGGGSGPSVVVYPDRTGDTQDAGGHTHTINGGDSETVPPHVFLKYLIKCDDLGATLV